MNSGVLYLVIIIMIIIVVIIIIIVTKIMQHNAEQCAVTSYRIIIMYDGDFLTVHTYTQYPANCTICAAHTHIILYTTHGAIHTEYIKTGFPVYIATSSSSRRRYP